METLLRHQGSALGLRGYVAAAVEKGLRIQAFARTKTILKQSIQCEAWRARHDSNV
jgi:hypothetical protein